ncbi:hypothetical protein H632_c5006p0, partial [Helicosporidium sp. ATCC 50920]
RRARWWTRWGRGRGTRRWTRCAGGRWACTRRSSARRETRRAWSARQTGTSGCSSACRRGAPCGTCFPGPGASRSFCASPFARSPRRRWPRSWTSPARTWISAWTRCSRPWKPRTSSRPSSSAASPRPRRTGGGVWTGARRGGGFRRTREGCRRAPKRSRLGTRAWAWALEKSRGTSAASENRRSPRPSL